MGYGRLGKSEPQEAPPLPETQQHDAVPLSPSPKRRRKKLLTSLLLLSTLLIIAASVSATLVVRNRTRGGSHSSEPLIDRKPTQAISWTCSKTLYPSLCINYLLDFPGSMIAGGRDLVHISVNMTLQRFGKALYITSEISNLKMDARVRSAYEDCIELLEDSVDALARSLNSISPSSSASSNGQQHGSTHDVLTWLSAALTNQDTCSDGLGEVSGPVKNQMEDRLRDLSELVSNCLAIFAAASGNDDFSGIPIQNKRRLMNTKGDSDVVELHHDHGYPTWMTRRDRELLNMPVNGILADIIVSQDGNGTVKTISEAIKKAPEYSSRRTIIYVKAGRYEENNLKVGRKKTNLMFIGDGKGKTVISGGKSVSDNMTTFHTASFAATGMGFIAKDMTFENWAGPSKHQAVALRVGADHAVVFNCSIIGYQDTLYVHSNRQFFRECDIYGTVDFIFGNAAVVFQNCSMYARKPLAMQKNTITAQNRKDPNQNTGISIHACRLLATWDLKASNGSFPTYLGRPWKLYSRTVYMLSYMGDHIHPRGWLEWNATFALDTLYYGEYMNYGPGAAVGLRVTWPGFRVITLAEEASKFTVGQFIYGSSWLPSTGIAFLAGLSV